MRTNVNSFPADVAALRAYCARNRVRHVDLAEALGITRSYVSHALGADRTGKSLSPEQLERLWQAAQRLARQRA